MKTNFKPIEIVTTEQADHITHGGAFHADEVMATAIMSAIMPLKLSRVFRAPEGSGAFVYDIGGGTYDHHQCEDKRRENGVPYSSAGLIWRDFGWRLVSCDEVWSLVDKTLIQGIDAIDNGAYPEVDYPAKTASVSSLISGFNPNWDERKKPDEAFLEAVTFAQGVLARTIESAESKVRAKTIVNQAIAESEGKVIVLSQFAPWQEYVLTSEDAKAAEALYVVFPSNRGGYNLQAIPDAVGSFGNRKPLPGSWCGRQAEDLRAVSGVADATFCHKGGFIGGAETLEGAMLMAQKAVEA